MNERDIRAQRAYAVREGRKEGFEKGHAEGLAEGRTKGLAEGLAEGMAEGMAEGKAEGKAEVAKAMLQGGVPVEQICRFTGLTEDRVKTL